jgi:AhpD family alkylhydroperoxidase
MNRQRLAFMDAAPGAVNAVLAAGRYNLSGTSLDERLLALVELRASQMNGCAFCTVLHINDARDAGETDERLSTVVVWRDVPYFSERERIAFELTEVLTDLVHNKVGDDLYDRALKEFGERGLADLIYAIATINAWNRINVALQAPPNQQFRSKMSLSMA